MAKAKESAEMKKAEIGAALEGAQHRQMVADSGLDDLQARADLLQEFEAYRSRFLAGFDEIEDDDDLAYYVAVKYVEAKAHWIQMNLRLNYQAVLKGAADQKMLVQAGLLSHFLGLVEPHVHQGHIQAINEMLATRLAA